MLPTIRLCKGKKARRKKVTITLNDVVDFYRQSSSKLQHKGKSVSIQVQIAQFGIGANPKQVWTSFRKKTAQKLERIEKNPLSVIATLLMIYREVLPSMIDVVSITPWDLLKTLCTGTGVAEFNYILFKAS